MLPNTVAGWLQLLSRFVNRHLDEISKVLKENRELAILGQGGGEGSRLGEGEGTREGEPIDDRNGMGEGEASHHETLGQSHGDGNVMGNGRFHQWSDREKKRPRLGNGDGMGQENLETIWMNTTKTNIETPWVGATSTTDRTGMDHAKVQEMVWLTRNVLGQTIAWSLTITMIMEMAWDEKDLMIERDVSDRVWVMGTEWVQADQRPTCTHWTAS